MPIEGSKKILLKNTVMLYVLRFSSYFFSFISFPYQTRVLSPAGIGQLGVAQALMSYFLLVVDFGFILSATEFVSQHREDRPKLSRQLSSVYAVKLVLTAASTLVLLGILFLSPDYVENRGLVLFYFVATIFDAFLPDFFYRGLEEMSAITYRTLAVKALSTVGIFVFLRTPSDIWVVPALTALGNGLSVLWSLWDLKRRFGIRFARTSVADCLKQFNRSKSFFLSRIAVTIYTSMNILVLKGFDPMQRVTTGYYTAADKLVTTGKSALTPIADSVYPYMIRNRDFKLIRRILLLLCPPIALGCLLIGVFADEVCVLISGEAFRSAGAVLRAMLPGLAIALPDYLLGFPCLAALQASKHANYSIYVSCAVHLICLALLALTRSLSVVTLAAASSVSIGAELSYRALIVYLCRRAERRSSP